MIQIVNCFVFVVCDCKDSDYFDISKNYFTFFDKNFGSVSKNCDALSKNLGALSKNFGAKNCRSQSKNCGSKNYCACMCVRGCVGALPILLTLAKQCRMQPEPEHSDQSDHHRTQATTTSSRATTTGTQRTRIAKEIKKTIANKIFLTFLQCIFAP